MSKAISRRNLVKTAGAAALAPAIISCSRAPSPEGVSAAAQWPIVEGPNTPKICLGGGSTDEAAMRRVKQLGVDWVIGGGVGPIPWQESAIRARMEALKAGGLNLYNMMISGFPNAILGRAGRDEEIEKVIQSIRAAGKAGLPVIEYNWYVHRAMEGYFEETGRAGIGHTGFDYSKMKDLPPLPEIGAHKAEAIWANIAYFLKAVIPVAEESNVRLALHPNDPPAPISRGSEQIMGTVAGWRRLIDTVNSPANGITFDPGVAREMGEDPVEVCRYFASRDRINHAHYRNVVVQIPYERYTEVSIDEGQVDMFGVMKELVRNKYTGAIYPEHPRALDYDREYWKLTKERRGGYPGGGGYSGSAFAVAYTRAMLQAALAG